MLVDVFYDEVHLVKFGADQRAVGPGQVTDVVQTQVVQDEHLPVTGAQLVVQVTRYVIVYLKNNIVR